MNRRTFLKKIGRGALAAGAAWGFPAIVPASALGRDGRPAPSNRITMAALGLGWMGGANLNAFLGKEEVQVVALCDIYPPHLEAALKKVNEHYKNQDCATYTDFREMIGRGDLDAIMIALPDHWHAIPAIMAARAGLDIYGEKPLSHNLPEGRAMVEAVTRYGRVWQTGSWQRSRSDFHKACELVRNGRIGRVRKIEVGLGGGHPDFDGTGHRVLPEPIPEGFDYDMWLGPAPYAEYCPARVHKTWRWNLDYGGGMLLDWVGHHVDIAHWAMGYDETGPVEVEGTFTWPTGLWNAPTEFDFTCRYADGVVMEVTSRRHRGGTKWIGDDGWVFVTRGAIEAHPASLLNEVIGPEEIRLPRSEDHYQNFLDSIRTREPTITPCETAHRSASVGHVCMVAGKLERKVRWNPELERFVDDPEADRLLSRPMRSPWHL